MISYCVKGYCSRSLEDTRGFRAWDRRPFVNIAWSPPIRATKGAILDPELSLTCHGPDQK